MSRIPTRFIGGRHSIRHRPLIIHQPMKLSIPTFSNHHFSTQGNLPRRTVTLPAIPTGFIDNLNKLTRSPLLAREVVRDDNGNVIGPPLQYVLSSINHGKDPFTLQTLAKTSAYFFLISIIMKAGIFNSPVALISAADDIGDTIVNAAKSVVDGDMPNLQTRYFDGFFTSTYKCNARSIERGADIPGVTCYQPGGSYYKRVSANPEEAGLWGYFGGLDHKDANRLFGLLALGGVAAFMYGSRRQFGHLLKVETNEAQETAAFKAITRNAVLSAMPALLSAALFGVGRELAHPIATWAMLTGAWAILSYEYRQPVMAGRAMSMRYALPIGALWIAGDALYRSLADSAGLYQFKPDGYATIYGNWHQWDWVINLPFLASDLVTDSVLFAPIWSRSGRVINQTVDVVLSAYSKLIHSNAADPSVIRRFFQDSIVNLSQVAENVGKFPHQMVRPSIQAFSENERTAVKSGQVPDGTLSKMFGHGMAAGTLGGTSYIGWNTLNSVLEGNSHHVLVDILLGGLGATSAFVLGHGVLKGIAGNSNDRNYYLSLASYLGHQFGPKGRAPYWIIYTLVGTVISMGIGVAAQTTKGIDPDKGYATNIGTRSLLNPWVNRIVFGMRTAFGATNISAFEFFAPGFFTVYSGLEFGGENGQMTKSTALFYEGFAREYSLTPDSIIKESLLEEMNRIEALARDAMENNGYGRPDTAKTAIDLMAKIASMKRQYGLPIVTTQEE